MKNKFIKGLVTTAAVACSIGAVPALAGCTNQNVPPVVEETKYSISVDAPDGVVYAISDTEAKAGATVELLIKSVAKGYIKEITMNGAKLDRVDGTEKYTFVMPAAKVQIKITVKVNEQYAIVVNSPSAIKWSLSHEKAEKDTEVTLKITQIAAGCTIKSLTLNGKELAAKSANTYVFAMPNRSVTINIKLDIDGDVVIDGDFVAQLTQEGESGLFVARDVLVDGTGEVSYFSWNIKEGGVKTALDTMDLDETRSFADIRMTAGSSSKYNFSISNGYKYDFFYDSNAEIPCYVQRKEVVNKPQNDKQLSALLITNSAVRAEYAIYADDYVGASYELHDTVNQIAESYTWDLYENNVSYGVAKNLGSLEEEDGMSVYKRYDKENGIYETVDEYKKVRYANNVYETNDDRYRLDYTGNDKIAARQVVTSDQTSTRYQIDESSALRNVRTSSHMPAYFVERNIMDAYRVGFNSDSGMTVWNIDVKSTDTANGFKVELNSFAEYDSAQTGATTSRVQEGTTYLVKFEFDIRGALKSLDYKKRHFNADEWDFVEHGPKTGKGGELIKTVKANYTYGAVKTGAPDFDTTPYFITSIDNVQLFNSKIQDADALTSGKSIVAINDRISLFDPFARDFSKVCKNKQFFTPSTALDVWQYGLISSTNGEVLAKTPYCAEYEMDALNEGTSTLTIGSHVPGYGASGSVDVEVRPGSELRSFFMDNSKSEDECYAEYADIKAGGTYSFYIGASPSDAAVKYHAVSSNPELLKVTSADNARYLTLDASGAKDITENITVNVTMESTYVSYMTPTVFRFTILPADINPIGTWHAVDKTVFPNTFIVFSDEVYSGEVKSGMEGALQGVIYDDYYDEGQFKSSDEYYFYYTYNSGKLSAVVYDIVLGDDSEAKYSDPKNFELEFYYQSTSGKYYVFLSYFEIDDEFEKWYDPVLGDWDQSSGECSYTPFVLDKGE